MTVQCDRPPVHCAHVVDHFFTHRHAPDWLILSIACVAQFMVVLDVSVVNVALPHMGHDLHLSENKAQWIINAYVLTFAGFLLLGGRAADLFGRRKVYLLGIGVFTIASVAAGFAAQRTPDDRRASDPGARRGDPVARHAHHHRHHIPWTAPAQGHRGLERGRGCGRRRRRARGRSIDRLGELAMGVLHQCSLRHRRRGRRQDCTCRRSRNQRRRPSNSTSPGRSWSPAASPR